MRFSPNRPFAESAFLLGHHKTRQLSTALKQGEDTQQRKPERLQGNPRSYKKIKWEAKRNPYENAWDVENQLNMPKYSQRLSQCHCVLLFSTLPLFPLLQPPEKQLSSIPASPNPSSSSLRPAQPHTLQAHHSLLWACTNCFFPSPWPVDGISAAVCTAPEEGTGMPRACRQQGLADASVNTMLICLRY